MEVVEVMPTGPRGAAQAPIRFEAVLSTLGGTSLVRLPQAASAQLPSRGQVAVHATLGGHPFETVVEPDGRRGHWVRVDSPVRQAAGIASGDIAEVILVVAPDWPEPNVPADLAAALAAAPARIRDVWEDITPMARWEWVRWVAATGNAATRRRRVEVSISKLDGGKRRPCCFDLSSCTDPDLATGGKLREPS
jgi:Domain of unknown function (DUF1905)/Bacteriocin-protection, YdeI or OmpD-Associated